MTPHSGNNRIAWPKGINTSFFILPVPNVTEANLTGALSFISGNCYYKKKDPKRYKPSIDGIVPEKQIVSKAIQLESLFLDATGDAADEDKSTDYARFQTNPSRQSSLLKSEHIKKIVHLTQKVVQAQCSGYVLTKLSVLCSLPGGQQQGIHTDDHRPPSQVESEGEMISVIFALQNDTKVDIEVNRPPHRQTFGFPSATILVFSGNLRHGGSAYNEVNIRLHMYFFPGDAAKHNKKENLIPLGLTCPVASCSFNVGGRSHPFTKTSLYNHWRNHHKKEFCISVGKY